MKEKIYYKQKIKELIKKIFLILPVRNIIIMESKPDFTDNTKLVFDQLIENKENDKYKIVWFVNNSKKFKDVKIKNVKFVDISKTYNLFKKMYYNFSAKIIIDCNIYVKKVRKKQFRLHLTHGTPLKNVEDYSGDVGNVDYILELSEFFKEKNAALYGKDMSYFLELGFPRNDELFSNVTIKDIFPEYEGKKIIVWLPTYRKHKDNEKYKDCTLRYGLPVMNSLEDFSNLDTVLKDNNVIILLKLHPAQDRNEIERFECKNIRVITDDQLTANNFSLYKLLAASDALITDYSAVYYDYLLTKKPIALAINDIEEFNQKVGFVYNYYDVIKGEYIYNSDELCSFIKDIKKGRDNKYDERMQCLKLYHTHNDKNSSKRVYEFIKKNMR